MFDMGFDGAYKEFEKSYTAISAVIDKKVRDYEKEAKDYLARY